LGSYLSMAIVSENKQKHDKLWDAIFPNKSWLSITTDMGFVPVLVGEDVRKRYDGSSSPAYIVLVTGDNSNLIADNRDELLKCLETSILS
jgi:hypothetical protein